MTPRAFLDNVVRNNVTEFNQEYGSIQRAYNAVAAVDALAAHIYSWCKTNDPSKIAGVADDSHYRGELAKRSPQFRLLRDIANAQKHIELVPDKWRGKRRGKKPLVTKYARVTARPFGFGEGSYGGGRYGGPPQVVVLTNRGKLRYVEQIVAAALEVLERKMKQLKI